MKKLFIIFSLLLFAVGLNAQFGSTKSLLPNQTYISVTPASTDSIHGSDAASTTHYYDFVVNRQKLYFFSFVIKLDSTKLHNRVLANHVWVQVLGSLDGTAFTAIGSPVKYGASVDSTFSYSDVSTGVLYKYLRVRFSGITANKCSTLSKLALKVADK